jgi:putative glutamine amidotransferase
MRIALTLDRDTPRAETNDYVRSLVAAGFTREEIEILGPGARTDGEWDGLVLGGGCDVDPSHYGERIRTDANVEIDPERDALDFRLFESARRDGTPVLAICRGLQVVNVALGGSLVQDLPTERPSPLVHDTPGKDKIRREHQVEIASGTRLAALAGPGALPVNSRHHQAVARPAAGLVVAATSPDGLVEAAEGAPGDPWLVGVQWHPENLAAAGDPASRRLFEEFARAVRARAVSPALSAGPARERG